MFFICLPLSITSCSFILRISPYLLACFGPCLYSFPFHLPSFYLHFLLLFDSLFSLRFPWFFFLLCRLGLDQLVALPQNIRITSPPGLTQTVFSEYFTMQVSWVELLYFPSSIFHILNWNLWILLIICILIHFLPPDISLS